MTHLFELQIVAFALVIGAADLAISAVVKMHSFERL